MVYCIRFRPNSNNCVCKSFVWNFCATSTDHIVWAGMAIKQKGCSIVHCFCITGGSYNNNTGAYIITMAKWSFSEGIERLYGVLFVGARALLFATQTMCIRKKNNLYDGFMVGVYVENRFEWLLLCELLRHRTRSSQLRWRVCVCRFDGVRGGWPGLKGIHLFVLLLSVRVEWIANDAISCYVSFFLLLLLHSLASMPNTKPFHHWVNDANVTGVVVVMYVF